MPIRDIICPICTEQFITADEVFSTTCGHLFHSGCLNDWLGRRDTCPHCCKSHPTPHKLHLRFDESEVPQKQEDLQIKIQSAEEKIAELTAQKQEREAEFLKLNEQYALSDITKRDLEIKVRESNNAEVEFMSLQAQYTESTEVQKQLEDRINQLFIANECKTRELQERTRENERLKTSLVTEQVGLTCNAEQHEKIKVLEQKLKFATSELEKEVNISSLLSVDKLKLEAYIKNYQSTQGKENITSGEQNKNPNSRNKNRNNTAVAKNLPNAANIEHLKANDDENKILIKGLSVSQLTVPFENIVIKLGTKMKIFLSSGDFISLKIMDNSFQNSSGIVLCVQFKDSKTKQRFISSAKLLENDPDFKTVSIEEFMNPITPELHDLLVYAKRLLNTRGLNFYYLENGKVFAKKNQKNPEAIHIQSRNHVLEIANRYDDNKKAEKMKKILT